MKELTQIKEINIMKCGKIYPTMITPFLKDVCIENMNKVIDNIDSSIEFGIYECPYPYKRILTTKFIEELLKYGRFPFIKDTCYDLSLIKMRADIFRVTH